MARPEASSATDPQAQDHSTRLGEPKAWWRIRHPSWGRD